MADNRPNDDIRGSESRDGRDFITYADVARMLSMSTRTVKRYVAQGKIPFHRFGGWTVRFNRAEIDAWVMGRQCG